MEGIATILIFRDRAPIVLGKGDPAVELRTALDQWWQDRRTLFLNEDRVNVLLIGDDNGITVEDAVNRNTASDKA